VLPLNRGRRLLEVTCGEPVDGTAETNAHN
jgi:hypothetical protein